MKKYILLLSILAILSGCQSFEEKYKKMDLEFMSVEKEGEIISGPVAIYGSDSEKKYFEASISSYEYNNFKLKKGDVVKAEIGTRDVGSLFISKYEAKIDGKETAVTPVDYFEK